MSQTADKQGVLCVRQDHVEASPATRVQRPDPLGRRKRTVMFQGQKRQFTPAPFARGWAKAAWAVQHGRGQAVPVHTHPGAASRTIPAGGHSWAVWPVLGWWLPGAVQPLIAVGREQQRP